MLHLIRHSRYPGFRYKPVVVATLLATLPAYAQDIPAGTTTVSGTPPYQLNEINFLSAVSAVNTGIPGVSLSALSDTAKTAASDYASAPTPEKLAALQAAQQALSTAVNTAIGNATISNLRVTGDTVFDTNALGLRIADNTAASIQVDSEKKLTIQNVTTADHAGAISTGEGGVLAINGNDQDAIQFINNQNLHAPELNPRGRAFAAGGAIANSKTGTLLLNNTLFNNNKVDGSASLTDGAGSGGAILNQGNAVISNSWFTDNISTGAYADGGAITSGTDVTEILIPSLSVISSDFSGNRAIALDALGEARGGAISQDGVLTIQDSVFSNNLARAPGIALGGAIWTITAASISGSSFDSNRALIGPGGSNAIGGAIGNSYGLLTVTDSNFTSNIAATEGETALTLTKGYGGAIYNKGDTVIQRGLFDNNIAGGSHAMGGAIDSSSDSTHADFPTLTVENSSFVNNSAISQYSGGPEGIAEGGAISNSAPDEAARGLLHVSNSVFQGNLATSFAESRGGAISADGETTVSDSTFESNIARTLGTDDSLAIGGAISNKTDGNPLTITGSHFTGNRATAQGTPASEFTSQQVSGGAVYNQGNTSVSNSDFTNNLAQGQYASGGAIENSSANGSTPVLTVNNTTFTGNSAVSDYTTGNGGSANGGAIAHDPDSGMLRGTLTIGNSVFTNNLASGAGEALGGAISAGGPTTISDSSFANNTVRMGPGGTQALGGAIASVFEEKLTLTNTDFSGNRILTDGPQIDNPYDKQSVNGAAVFTRGDLDLNTTAGKTSLFSGNTITDHGSTRNNAIYLGYGATAHTLNVNTDTGSTLDMRDPLEGTSYNGGITVNKNGAGVWKLGGKNSLVNTVEGGTDVGSGKSTFAVNAGTLYLYGQGEVANATAANPGAVVDAGTLTLAGTGSAFTLGTGATLSASGGNAITVSDGGINIADGSTLSFNLDRYDTTRDGTKGMLALAAGTSSVGSVNVNVNGISREALSSTDFTPKTLASFDTSAVGGNASVASLSAGGQKIYDIDGVSSTDQFLYGKAFFSADKKTLSAALALAWEAAANAHGTFNIQNGAFTLDAALADNVQPGAGTTFGWDGKSLTKTGAGTLILNGKNIYTGLTSVNAGSLIVGGTADNAASAQIAGPVAVSNATLGGYGTILGPVNLNAGGILSPGNSVGTLTTGDVNFNNGSTYKWEGNAAGGGDLLKVNGKATIASGSSLSLNGATAGEVAKVGDYTLIQTTGGINGQFSNVQNNFAFLNYALNYAAAGSKDLMLTLSRNKTAFQNVADTFNRRSVAHNLDSMPTDNQVVKSVTGLSVTQARKAFDNLSGESYASARTAMLQNSRYARDAINGHLMGVDGGRQGSAWVTTWGHGTHQSGDGNATALTNNGFGVMVGADLASDEKSVMGIAAGFERNNLHMSDDRESKNEVNSYHAGAYGSTRLGAFDFRGGVIYSYLDSDSERDIWVPGLQGKNKASYGANQIQAFVEASHTVKINKFASFAPYANLAQVWLKTDGVNESGNASALKSGSSHNNVTFSTLGLRGKLDFDTSLPASLGAKVGWAHADGDVASKNTQHFASGGSDFAVKGVPLARDSVISGVSLTAKVGSNSSVGVGYQGQFGKGMTDNVGYLKWVTNF